MRLGLAGLKDGPDEALLAARGRNYIIEIKKGNIAGQCGRSAAEMPPLVAYAVF